MKISFEQQDTTRIEKNRKDTQHIENGRDGRQRTDGHGEIGRAKNVRAQGAYFQTGGAESWMLSSAEKGKSLTELQQEAANTDVAVMQDFRTVLSHTVSEEDYAKMQEEGFDFSEMDPETAVTIVDKIKAELVRSGQYIAGYTDTMDMDTLAAALGSDALAGAISDSFKEANIPFTQENLDTVKKAWDMASNLTAPTQDVYRYMVDNAMEPEIWDFYLAQSSSAQGNGNNPDATARQPKFYAEEIDGYYAESANHEIDAKMREEIDKLLTREGLLLDTENRYAAERLLTWGVALTGENIEKLEELQRVTFPVTEEIFAKAAASALTEGKEPIHANLVETENIYDKAVSILKYFETDAEQNPTLGDLISRRQLEEVRLRMTAEVNVKLIRSGFSIDTAPMEQLLKALRQAESEIAAKYFPGDNEAVSKYELYQDVNRIAEELPGLPARVIGWQSAQEKVTTLTSFYETGKVFQESYEKAQERYETLMTAPRKDLGDSIRKAFGNVDAILEDLNQDVTEENRRAVRILGYNRMSIDEGNIERVKHVDAQVRSVVDKMTPASVLKMIREGINPLEQSFDELENYLEAGTDSSQYEEESKSYSRFLYHLEHNHEISAQERESYIGIYRMIRQIERTDGAAIGALVNTGAEIQFANLLSAVRSGKFKSMDVSVTENFGATVEVVRNGESISEQIAKGFVENAKQILTEVSYSEEADAIYRHEELEQLREAAQADAACVELLGRGELSQSADHLLTAQALLHPMSNPYVWKMAKDKKDARIENLLEHMDEKEVFQEECEQLAQDKDGEVREFTLQNADTEMDVRELRLLHKQLSVAAHLAKQEEYIFPMYVGDDLAKVHFRLDRDGGEKGRIDIAVNMPDGESFEAHFRAESGRITGYLAGNTDAMVMKLEKAADIFSDSVRNGTENHWEVEKLPVTDRQSTNGIHQKSSSSNREVPDGKETYREVDNKELYRIAKVFLKAVQK